MGECHNGRACACAGVDTSAGAVRHLVVWSATGHTLDLMARIAREHGADATVVGRTCTIVGDDVGELIEVLSTAATATERQEARALVIEDDTLDRSSMIDVAMAAPSIGTLAAQRRYRHLAGLASDLDRFHARFQPIVDLATEQTVAFESLLRASDDTGGEIPAGDLFAAAAAGVWSNVLDRIGREVAMRDAAGWLGDRQLFINFIPTSIYRPEVCLATTFAAARRHGIPTSQIVFEVVETHRTEDVGHLLSVVDFYRQRGTSIALDDVGSGYSSLSIVAQVRPDIVKVEQQLVRAIDDPASKAIVRAVIQMSHELGAKVVAEGVETAEQVAVMREFGVDLAQGWFFGRPERADHWIH